METAGYKNSAFVLLALSILVIFLIKTNDFGPNSAATGPPSARGSDASSHAMALRLELNSATAERLSLLPGIGTVLAERIVSDRNSRGLFSSVDELARVRGIGKLKLASLRDFLVLGPERNDDD